jgi:hypothetical protein
MAKSSPGRTSAQRRLVELRFGAPLPAVLRQLRGEGLSASAVASRVEISYRTVHRWLVDFELDDATLIRKALAETEPGGGR